jgi:mannonate dehydratase
VDELLRQRVLGCTAIRIQSGVPGLRKVYGVADDGKPYEPATRGLPTEQDWDSGKYPRHAPALFEAARAAVGQDVDLLHDVHHCLTPIEAARLGKDLEPYRLFWMEDATPTENQEAFRLIRRHTTTPIAVGGIFNTLWDCKQLIEER